MCACAQKIGAVARKSLRRDRPGWAHIACTSCLRTSACRSRNQHTATAAITSPSAMSNAPAQVPPDTYVLDRWLSVLYMHSKAWLASPSRARWGHKNIIFVSMGPKLSYPAVTQCTHRRDVALKRRFTFPPIQLNAFLPLLRDALLRHRHFHVRDRIHLARVHLNLALLITQPELTLAANLRTKCSYPCMGYLQTFIKQG